MSDAYGPDPADLRHDEIVENLVTIHGLLRELLDEIRATRNAHAADGMLLRQAIREARR